MTQDQIREKLHAQDWDHICEALIAFVAYYLKHFGKNVGAGSPLSKWISVEDIAFEAIAAVWTFKRKWNPEKHPDLLNYMQFSVCRSIISNSLCSLPAELWLEVWHADQTSIDNVPFYDSEIDVVLFFKYLKEEMDLLDFQIFMLMIEGHSTNDICNNFEISPNEVNNAKRRIKRTAKRVLNASTTP